MSPGAPSPMWGRFWTWVDAKNAPASSTRIRRLMSSPKRYSFSAHAPPNMPEPITTTSNGAPPLFLTSSHVLHTYLPNRSCEKSVCCTSTFANGSAFSRGSMEPPIAVFWVGDSCRAPISSREFLGRPLAPDSVVRQEPDCWLRGLG